MSAFKALLKKLKPDEILAQIDTPEKAVALRGEDRAAYLNALDQVYGDKNIRREAMGFDPKTYYHGTTTPTPINQFDTSKEAVAGYGSYFTPDLGLAENYASLQRGSVYPVNLKNNLVETLPNEIVNNLTQKQVAAHLDISVVTVSRQVKKGLDLLKKIMVGATED
jgi:hypothetical protein